MAKAEETGVISARVPLEFFNTVEAFVVERDPVKGGRTRVIVAALEAFMKSPPQQRQIALLCDMDNCEELGRWQQEIYKLIKEETGADTEIDGGGCDSGDPLDLTLTEISQGFGYIENRCYEALQAAGYGEKLGTEGESALDVLLSLIPPAGPPVKLSATAAKVLRCFEGLGEQTSLDAAWLAEIPATSAAKRIQELVGMGYLKDTGKKAKSRNSSAMITVYALTGKKEK